MARAVCSLTCESSVASLLGKLEAILGWRQASDEKKGRFCLAMKVEPEGNSIRAEFEKKRE